MYGKIYRLDMRRSERLPPKVTFWRVIFAEYVRFNRAKALFNAYVYAFLVTRSDFPKLISAGADVEIVSDF